MYRSLRRTGTGFLARAAKPQHYARILQGSGSVTQRSMDQSNFDISNARSTGSAMPTFLFMLPRISSKRTRRSDESTSAESSRWIERHIYWQKAISVNLWLLEATWSKTRLSHRKIVNSMSRKQLDQALDQALDF